MGDYVLLDECFKCGNVDYLLCFNSEYGLLAEFKCKACGTLFEVDYDESYDGEEEYQHWGFSEL